MGMAIVLSLTVEPLFSASPASPECGRAGLPSLKLEHFQEKWEPVFRPKMRQTKLEHFQEKWEPVFRPKMRQTKMCPAD
jgi:hypothetical protein